MNTIIVSLLANFFKISEVYIEEYIEVFSITLELNSVREAPVDIIILPDFYFYGLCVLQLVSKNKTHD